MLLLFGVRTAPNLNPFFLVLYGSSEFARLRTLSRNGSELQAGMVPNKDEVGEGHVYSFLLFISWF